MTQWTEAQRKRVRKARRGQWALAKKLIGKPLCKLPKEPFSLMGGGVVVLTHDEHQKLTSGPVKPDN